MEQQGTAKAVPSYAEKENESERCSELRVRSLRALV